MLYNYLAIIFFAFVAAFVPLSTLLLAKLLRHKTLSNPVKEAPYESAEATIGKNRDVMNDYLPYFMLFLPVEIIAIVALLWSLVARQVSYADGVIVLGTTIVSAAFALFGYALIRGNNE
ncbi:NADH-quinone oxidoreductase subunit A [Candidatus Marsarchaeota archaeon]|jgi:NADH:ubiquinone oxidoreductase subunit 3 (subunit A)|nr:NADH-quinone oxidoreductase subunit A [Candidatus Marsarchaeota archaeon]